MDFLFATESPLFDFLEPLELIKMLHFNKAARKAAVPKLKEFQAIASTAAHATMFKKWLKKPTTSKKLFERIDQNTPWHTLAGPLRFDTIEQLYDSIRKKFVILSYENTYTQESSCVAIFNNNGTFVSYYELKSEQFYEPFVDSHMMFQHTHYGCGGELTNEPNFQIQSTVNFHSQANCSNERWKLRPQFFQWDSSDGFMGGDVLVANYALFRIFQGILSPTKVGMILIHALTTDTRILYSYSSLVFHGLDREWEFIVHYARHHDFGHDMDEDEKDEAWFELEIWHENLPGV